MIKYKLMDTETLIMKYITRGSLCFGLLALIMTFFYFQQTVEAALETAINSQDSKQINLQQSTTQNITIEDALNNKLETRNIKTNLTAGLTTNSDNNIDDSAESSENKSEMVSEARTFRSTAYCLRGKTASGRSVRRGIVAADTRVLPLGTRIRLDAGKYSGTYVVADTGGKIKGRILDIWVPSCAEARRWGRRNVKVTVLGKGKRRKR